MRKRAIFERFLRLLLVAGSPSLGCAQTPAPAWWGWEDDDSGQVAVEATAPAAHRAPATLGQAKWMAHRALMELRAVLPASAARVEAALADEDVITDWSFPVTEAEKQAPSNVLLSGQLKALAAPFYDELKAVAFSWLANEMQLYNIRQPGWPSNPYPWGPAEGSAQNHATATLGQLKAVFSLDFWADREGGNDGSPPVPDLWESYLANLDPLDSFTAISQINNSNVDAVGMGLGAGKRPKIDDPETSPFEATVHLAAQARRVSLRYEETQGGQEGETEVDTLTSSSGVSTLTLHGTQNLSDLQALLKTKMREAPLTDPGEELAQGHLRAEAQSDGSHNLTATATAASVLWESQHPVPHHVRIPRLLVTKETTLSDGSTRVLDIEPVTFVIARGGTRSQEIELTPVLENGKRLTPFLLNPIQEPQRGDPTAVPGTVTAATLAVNDGDVDSDHLLDYADGLVDKFQTQGTHPPAGAIESPSFYAIDLQVASEDVQVSLEYPGSNPSLMFPVHEPGEGVAPQALAPTGTLRLWDQDGSVLRRISGDYIAPGSSGPASVFGATAADKHLRVFVESVRPSDQVGDQSVTITVDEDGPGPAGPIEHLFVFTSIRTAFHAIEEDNRTTRLYGLRPSLPHPTVEDTAVVVSDLKPTPDGSGLSADIRLTGTIHSAICDLTPGEQGTAAGTITTAYIGLNGAAPTVSSNQSATVSVSKGQDPQSLRRPYPYEGSFEKTLQDVPVLEGDNTIKVSVHDPEYRLTGTVTVPFSVEAQPPGANNSNGAGVAVLFPGADSTLPANGIRLDYFDTTGAAVIDSLLLTQNPSNTAQYTGGSTTVNFTATPTLNPSVVDTLILAISSTSPAVNLSGISIQETDAASEILTWGVTDVTHTSYEGWSVTDGGVGAPEATGPGDYHPLALRLDGPEALLASLRTVNIPIAQGDGDELSLPVTRSRHDGAYYLAHEERPHTVASAVALPLRSRVETHPGFDLTQAGPPADPQDPQWVDDPGEPKLGELQYTFHFLDRNQDGELSAADILAQVQTQAALYASDVTDFRFYKGFVKGFFGNPVDTGKELYGLAKAGAQILHFLNPINAAASTVKKLRHEFSSGDQFQAEIKAMGEAWDKGYEIFEKAKTWVPKVGAFLQGLGENGTATIVQSLISGEFPGADDLSEEERLAIDVVFLLVMMAENWWSSLDAEKRGYYSGYIAFEVVAVGVGAVVTAPIGGAAAGALLARHVPKLLHVIRTIRPILTSLNAGSVPGLEKLQDLIVNLGKIDTPLMTAKLGKWCLVAGTPVMTVSGAMAIERVEPGMIVLSAPEDGVGRIEARPVVAVHRSMARETVSISYDHDGDGETPEATVESTPGHPFYVEEQGAFVPASALHPGATLRLATGARVAVTAVSTRSGVRVPVYNFAVADFHTYFAGPGGVWVHNVCPAKLDEYAAFQKARMDELTAGGTPTNTAWDEAFESVLEKVRNDPNIPEDEIGDIVGHLLTHPPAGYPRIGTLEKVADGIWKSPITNLRYGLDSQFGNRVKHVLNHAVDWQIGRAHV